MRREATLAAVVIGGAAGFFGLAQAIQGAARTDERILRALGRTRTPLTEAIARGITFFGSVGGGAIASLGASILTRRRPRAVAQIVVGSVGGLLAELLVKRFFQRKRPTLLRHLEEVSSSSFPSGHSMAAASIYLTLAFVHGRPRDLALATVLASAVGTSRVYLGVHWPTDALAGLVLGTAWACGTEAVLNRRASPTDRAPN